MVKIKMESKQVPVQLYDPEADAQRCESGKKCILQSHAYSFLRGFVFIDVVFAQQIFGYAIRENECTENEEVGGKSEEVNDEANDQANAIEDGEDKTSTWLFNETLALIAAYDIHKENFKVAKKRKFVWQDISNELISNNIEKSASKCESKWRNLLRTYKNVKDHKNSTGRGVVKFKFFDKMDEILGDKPIMNCSHTYSSTTTNTDSKASTSESTHEDHKDNTPNVDTTDASLTDESDIIIENVDRGNRKRKRLTDDVLKKKSEELIDIKINYFKKKQADQENRKQRRERKIEVKERMLAFLQERKIALSEKYIEKDYANKKWFRIGQV